MPALQAFHGRIVDLRRHTNVHQLYGRRPIGPSDRYELWIRSSDRSERKFTVNTRTMPARRGHEVCLIVTRTKAAQVLALINLSTNDGVNYARTDARGVVRPADFVLLPLAFLAAVLLWGETGMAVFVPAAVLYLLAACIGRATWRCWLARRVDRLMDATARRLTVRCAHAPGS